MRRVVIVDDEPLARKSLRLMLEPEPGVDCVGEARTGPEAIAILDRERPDAVFLDIEMPGASGLDVLRRIERIPLVVFTTAFDRYAVSAFDLEAVDFLLKPFGRRRFAQAMAKLRREWSHDGAATPADERPRRLFASRAGRVVPLRVDSIELFQGAGDYVKARTAGAEHLLNHRLKELERSLDPERFVRVHRSWIVNLDWVEGIGRGEDGGLEVSMLDGTRLPVSRRRARELRLRTRSRR